MQSPPMHLRFVAITAADELTDVFVRDKLFVRPGRLTFVLRLAASTSTLRQSRKFAFLLEVPWSPS